MKIRWDTQEQKQNWIRFQPHLIKKVPIEQDLDLSLAMYREDEYLRLVRHMEGKIEVFIRAISGDIEFDTIQHPGETS